MILITQSIRFSLFSNTVLIFTSFQLDKGWQRVHFWPSHWKLFGDLVCWSDGPHIQSGPSVSDTTLDLSQMGQEWYKVDHLFVSGRERFEIDVQLV